MAVISQSLVVPTGLVNGQASDASQITPLYTAMNAFNIPDSLFVWTTALADDTLYTVTAGNIETFTVSLPQAKSFFFYIPYLAGDQHTTVELYMNGTKVTATTDITPQAGTNQSGMLIGFCGRHDGTFKWPLLSVSLGEKDTAPVWGLYAAGIPNAALTSFAVKCVAVGPLSIQGVRIFGEA